MDNKKYFLKETGEELKFGDVIELNCVKELEDGRVTVEKEIKFSPETVDALICFDIIEVEEPMLDFPDEKEDFDFEEFVENVIEDLENNESRLCAIEEKLKQFEQAANTVKESKNGSSKKK